jgi:hypothetical protein
MIQSQPALNINLLNISSVMCPHEIITRPFVFIHTNAEPEFWLLPNEVANKALELVFKGNNGFIETDLFHASNYHFDGYDDNYFGERKIKELYK